MFFLRRRISFSYISWVAPTVPPGELILTTIAFISSFLLELVETPDNMLRARKAAERRLGSNHLDRPLDPYDPDTGTDLRPGHGNAHALFLLHVHADIDNGDHRREHQQRQY